MRIVFAIRKNKKSTISSTAKHHLHLICVVIWDLDYITSSLIDLIG